MIVPQRPSPTPLVLPAVDVWELSPAGELLGIASAWEADGEIVEARAGDVSEWLDGIKRAWKSTAPKSPERWSVTHRLLPDGDDGWVALLQQGMKLLPDWRARRQKEGLAGVTVKVSSRITLHLGSAQALIVVPLSELEPGELTARGVLAGLRTVAERLGLTGRCPLSLTGVACRLFTSMIRYPIVTPVYPKQLAFEQDAVSPPRIEAVPGYWPAGVQYDVIGCYTAAMERVQVPSNPMGHWTVTYEGSGIYRGEFSQPAGLPPILRDAESGEFRHQGAGTFCSNEIDMLLGIGGTFAVEMGFRYHFVSRLFGRFARRCWGLRQRVAGEPVLSDMAKQLPLRLYGLMLSTGVRQELVPHTPDLAPGTFSLLTPDIAEVETEETNPWRAPALGAFVLAEGRLILWKAICAAVKGPGSVVSAYVDSLVVVGAELVPGADLGDLREVARGPVSVVDAQRVVVGRKLRGGGLPRTRRAAEAIEQAAQGYPALLVWETRAAAIEALRDGIAAGSLVSRKTTVLRKGGGFDDWRRSWRELHRRDPLPEYVPELGVYVNPDGSEARPRPDGPDRMGGRLPRSVERTAADD